MGTMKNETEAEAVARIAREMGIATLEERRSDRLDFHDVAVWSLRHALEAAYAAGKEAGILETVENDRRFAQAVEAMDALAGARS